MKTYETVTISLAEGSSVSTERFPTIQGRIVSMGTTVIGTRPEKSINITLKDNGNELHRPVDINFTETTGRNSFHDGLLEIGRNKPGNITAELTADAVLANGEDFKVQVLLVVEDESQLGPNC